METKEDFIQAMRAMPDDVVLMCAFSDWLEEHDDPMWEGMSLLAHYGITGKINRYRKTQRQFYIKKDIGSEWYKLRYLSYMDISDNRIRLCDEYCLQCSQKKNRIRQELAELYPNSDAMRAAVDRSTPA